MYIVKKAMDPSYARKWAEKNIDISITISFLFKYWEQKNDMQGKLYGMEIRLLKIKRLYEIIEGKKRIV